GTRVVPDTTHEERRSTTMIRTIGGAAALALALFGGGTFAMASDDACFYRGTMFSHGAMTCQAGTQYRCNDGEWEKRSGSCQEDRVAASKPCDFGGIAYSTGSASCQDGMQSRCEDGTWRRLNTSCTIGDAPIRALPSGRTCMFDGATVAN